MHRLLPSIEILMSRKAKQRFWLACCSVLYQCIEHADDTIVSFGNKVCFESWNYCAGRSGEKHSTISCFFPHFFRALASFCVLYNRTEHSQGFSICNCYAHFLFVCRIYTGVYILIKDEAKWRKKPPDHCNLRWQTPFELC